MGSKKLKREVESKSSTDDESDQESQQEFEQYMEEEDEDEQSEEELKVNEEQRDAEMEQLEEEYKSLRNGEQDIQMYLKRHKDEDFLKGQAVKNQMVIWNKTLELRFLLQKVYSSSNKLPQEPVRSSFCGSDEAVDKAYSDLIISSEKTLDCLVDLQEALLEKNPSIIQVTDGSTKAFKATDGLKCSDDENDKEWPRVQQLHSRIAPFRDSSIDKWQRKSQVTTGVAGFKGKLQAFSQNISEQVATYMKDPSRMIKRMQLRRPVVGVFGAVTDVSDNVKEEHATEDGDPELLDDSEFYQQLLREFFESFYPTTSEVDFHALKRQQTKKRKIVDRRASKSRKIRYHVHEKIVSFMAPEPRNLPDMAPILFENLFGLKHPKPTPA